MSDRHRWAFLILGIILVLGAIAVFWWTRRPGEERWTVRRGDLTGALDIPGRIVALRTVPLRAPFDTRVRVLAVSVGDTVRAGEIVAVLDDSPLVARRDQAERQLWQAEAALAQAETTGTPLAERLRAERQRRDAAQAYAEATAGLAQKYVVAPLDGLVTDVVVAEGAPVGAGTVLVRIVDPHMLGVGATIDEVDMRYFAGSEEVRVTVDALPGWEGRGEVVSLSQIATQQAGVVGFPLTVRLTEASDDLRPGMTATIHLAAVIRRNVLLVPEQAVRTVGERAFVTVLRDGKREDREVTLGLRSGGLVEVAAGLTEGEQVVLQARQ